MNTYAPPPTSAMGGAAEPPLLASLIRTEMVELASQLAQTYADLEKGVADGLISVSGNASRSLVRAREQTALLTGKMELLATLADTYTGDRDERRERLFLGSLVSQILAPGGMLAHLNQRFELVMPPGDVGSIYGSKKWLNIALTHLLSELSKGSPPGLKIVLVIRQIGNHQLLVSRDESLQKFGLKSPQKATSRKADAVLLPNLSFSLCRRIAELHGGTLKLTTDHEGVAKLSGLTLSLPTGSGAEAQTRNCDNCPLSAQIERYAEDLAELLDRCRTLEKEGSHHGKAAHR